MQALVPELYVSDFVASLSFYVDVLGFEIAYQRPLEQFAFLRLGDAELMIEQPTGRRWLLAPLEHPFGRGVNLQLSVPDVDALHNQLNSHAVVILVPLETKRYERDADSICVRQFVVSDPDGYLLRFAQTLSTDPY